MGSVQPSLSALQRRHRACTLCVTAGMIPRANPVFSGHAGQRILLVGQAPGIVEADVTRPFAGRAGRELMRWMTRAGFDSEDDFRERVYMTSMTTCFPGRRPGGGGDRSPSTAEVALCSRWLDGVLGLLQPRLIIPVGGLALSRFIAGRRLEDVVGAAVDAGGARVDGDPRGVPVYLPLPHPSGQSRWNNVPRNVALREQALERLRELVAWAHADHSWPDASAAG